MILKNADPKDQDIATLQALSKHPNATFDVCKKIEQQIRNIQAGVRGEGEVAYETKVHFGESKNCVIIHDLRIEHGGLVAQIDHLIMNRFLEMWVCESKHFSEGVGINEQGEFVGFYAGKPYGVPSPLAQNDKHILVLQRMFRDGVVDLPTRLGITIKPNLKGLVLVSKKARISRPKKTVPGLDCVIKNDQLAEVVLREPETGAAFLQLGKVIGADTLEQLARQIVRQHRPIVFNWAARFGLTENKQNEEVTKIQHAAQKTTALADRTVQKLDEVPGASLDKEATPKQKLICHKCQSAVPYNVAKFCWFNKPKFGGHVFCMDCQKTV